MRYDLGCMILISYYVNLYTAQILTMVFLRLLYSQYIPFQCPAGRPLDRE